MDSLDWRRSSWRLIHLVLFWNCHITIELRLRMHRIALILSLGKLQLGLFNRLKALSSSMKNLLSLLFITTLIYESISTLIYELITSLLYKSQKTNILWFYIYIKYLNFNNLLLIIWLRYCCNQNGYKKYVYNQNW